MRIDPQTLLRGLGKFAAVVLAAGLAGALIGVALSKLAGNDEPSAPVTTAPSVAATTPARTTTAAAAAATTPARTTTAAATPTTAVYRVPRVQVLSAQLGPVDDETARAPVTVRVRVTNRGARPLSVTTALLSGSDEFPLPAGARSGAGELLRPIASGDSATGALRFTVPSPIAQRLTATPAARLRLANRTVVVRLTTNQPTA